MIEVAGLCVIQDRQGGCIPLLHSEDGGRTWAWVDLPEPPGGWAREPDLRLQPDGSLMLRSGGSYPTPGDAWHQLRRGKTAWEPTKAPEDAPR